MSDEIKPCPFCGGKAHVAEGRIWYSVRPKLFEVVCNDDSCRGGYDHAECMYSWSKTREKAIEIWNMRVTDE